MAGGRAGRRGARGACAGEPRSRSRAAWGGGAPDPPAGRPPARAGGAEGAARAVAQAAEGLRGEFAAVDGLVLGNVRRVQAAFAGARVGAHHMAGSSGYGHGDLGRGALDAVMAAALGAEAACVRAGFVSGTHAIACGLFGTLRPEDTLLAAAGPPYDTLEEVIGLRGCGRGSLAEWGVAYREVALAQAGGIDFAALGEELARQPRPAAVLVQRSCGYSLRPTVSLADIARVVELVRARGAPGCRVLVYNCYGEFSEEAEPCAVGADLAMGSPIKAAGGTLAPCGGYVAGRRDLVEAAQARLTAPGVGLEAGAHGGETNRLMLQGLYLAPMAVGEALKGGRLVAAVMEREGFEVFPPAGARPEPITSVRLGSAAKLQAFCSAVQQVSPVGSYIRPVPGATPGYADEVLFADGTFVDGSTAEMSADGPLREPFAAYCQGGNHWTQWALALEAALPAVRAA